jgi:hypothetical protein
MEHELNECYYSIGYGIVDKNWVQFKPEETASLTEDELNSIVILRNATANLNDDQGAPYQVVELLYRVVKK